MAVLFLFLALLHAISARRIAQRMELKAQTQASCSFSGTVQDFGGADLPGMPITYSGSDDASKDASCCNACSSNSACQFWVRATDSNHCWLKTGFTGYNPSGVRRGNFRASCAFMGTVQDLGGADLPGMPLTYSGSDDASRDAWCCNACSSNSACQFWVRATDSSHCWLKTGFSGYSPSSARRGNFKTGTAPAPAPASNYYSDCVTGVNNFRKTLGLPALTRNTAQEQCANTQSGNDLVSNVAHAHFGACSEWGQCECPNWQDPSQIQACLQMMWNEGPGGGHYDIMSSTTYHSMACGYTTVGTNTWMVQNYYP